MLLIQWFATAKPQPAKSINTRLLPNNQQGCLGAQPAAGEQLVWLCIILLSAANVCCRAQYVCCWDPTPHVWIEFDKHVILCKARS